MNATKSNASENVSCKERPVSHLEELAVTDFTCIYRLTTQMAQTLNIDNVVKYQNTVA